jgi:glycosyltransferase involved in cell wall biosynthesis
LGGQAITNSAEAEAILGRICLVSSNFPRWAGDSTTPFVLHLAQDLQDLGWQVEVLAPHAPGAEIEEVLAGVTVHRFRYLWPESQETVCYRGGALINLRRNPSNWLKVPALVFCEWLALRRLAASHRFDLINSHWVLPQGFVGVLASRGRGLPHVVTVHGGDVFGLRGRLTAFFKRFAFFRADAVTVNSSATLEAVRGVAPGLESVHRIPMGADTARPSDNSGSEILRQRYRRGEGPLLIFVGRIVEEKGIGDLIRAMKALASSLPDVTLLVVGEGQERPAMEALAHDLGVADRITFAGWLPSEQISSYLAAADIFVGPSKQAPNGWVEALGLTFVEALISRTPVVATRSGGIVDVIRHEETGLLVAENAPDEIAAAVSRLYHNPTLARRLVKAGHSHAMSAFTREASAQAFSDLFLSLREGAKVSKHEWQTTREPNHDHSCGVGSRVPLPEGTKDRGPAYPP